MSRVQESFFRNPLRLLLAASFALLIFISGCSSSEQPARLKVRVNVKIISPSLPDTLFITGNQNSLGLWNPQGLGMTSADSSFWYAEFITDNNNLRFKFTTGTWWQQGLDSGYSLTDNYSFRLTGDTVLNLVINRWSNNKKNGYPLIDASDLKPEAPFLELTNSWKFNNNDSGKFALPGYNDSSWSFTQSAFDEDIRRIGWNGKGWFRFSFYIPDTVKGTTVAFRINHLGASEIWYNGRLFQKTGEVGDSSREYTPRQNRVWRAFTFDKTDFHVIAVRYANYGWEQYRKAGFTPGFIIFIKDPDSMFSGIYESTKNIIREQLVFSLIPLILFFFHLILYLLNRGQKQNLFFALCLLGFAGITFFNYQKYFENDPFIILLYYKLNAFSVAMAVFFGLLTSYAMTYENIPRRWIFFFILFCTISIAGLIFPVDTQIGVLNYVYFGVTAADILYSGFRRNRLKVVGAWINFIGFVSLFFFVIIQILIDYGVINSFFGTRLVFVYGLIALAVSMSVFIAYNYAMINKNLAMQLANVKELSQKTLEQEKINSSLELERRIISIENERKTKELESARQLQLSLLPSEFPKAESLDIYARMITASEVGGDYYDFFTSGENGLLFVTGDATGHGIKAGSMVMTIKGMLNMIKGEPELSGILKDINDAVRKMNLKLLYMSLTLIRIKQDSVEIASAGMPPVILFRSDTKETEYIFQKSMPAGGVKSFPYISQHTEFRKGDILVSASDGVSELFNDSEEMFGFERISEVLKLYFENSAEVITEKIFESAGLWSANAPLRDDMTIMVVKKT